MFIEAKHNQAYQDQIVFYILGQTLKNILRGDN